MGFSKRTVSLTKRIDLPLFAIGFYVGNLMIMVLISSLVKLLSAGYPVSQILFFRYAFAVIPLFLFMCKVHGISSLRTTRYKDHAIRTISGIVALGLFFYALTLIPLAEATMLANTSPIFITVLSIPILAEHIGFRRWGAVVVGFIGVIIISQPGSEVFGFGSLVALGAAFFAAFVVIWLRVLSDTENATTTSIIYNATGCVVFGLWVLIAGWTTIQSGFDLALLMAIGFSASFQQFFFAVSFRYGEASLLAPFEYLVLVFAAIVGYYFWSEVPPLTSIIGGLVIICSGIFILARSRKADAAISQK